MKRILSAVRCDPREPSTTGRLAPEATGSAVGRERLTELTQRFDGVARERSGRRSLAASHAGEHGPSQALRADGRLDVRKRNAVPRGSTVTRLSRNVP